MKIIAVLLFYLFVLPAYCQTVDDTGIPGVSNMDKYSPPDVDEAFKGNMASYAYILKMQRWIIIVLMGVIGALLGFIWFLYKKSEKLRNHILSIYKKDSSSYHDIIRDKFRETGHRPE